MSKAKKIAKMELISLIREIEKQPLLWDKTSPEYLNKEAKRNTWQAIALNLGLTYEDAKFKWDALKKIYRVEMGRYLRSHVSGDGIKPKWPYLSIMQFLRGHITVSEKKADELDITREEKMSTTDLVSLLVRKKQNQNRVMRPLMPLDNSENNPPKSKKNQVRKVEVVSTINQTFHADEDYHFLLSLLEPLRRIPMQRKSFFKLRLLQLFCKEQNEVMAQNPFNPYGLDNKLDSAYIPYSK
ncbi:uncharacterized protein LOC106666195 isoform X1 [Cimex lectularius]|uniref:MADF domain-containing protein n=1 Tax=Cimex lectularius TaxID=79782 RepID=A0A8I6TGS7_CIMLE|nr:uncharacterized protein LOC106666195 isoform X1 [Cimex lectularius]